MQYRTLGKDLTVSAVGLGCMGMSHAYGAPADKKDMVELLARAVDRGLATKFSIHFDMDSNQVNKPLVPDSKPEVIRASMEDSLRRLCTDHIDLQAFRNCVPVKNRL